MRRDRMRRSALRSLATPGARLPKRGGRRIRTRLGPCRRATAPTTFPSRDDLGTQADVPHRDPAATRIGSVRLFFAAALRADGEPVEVVTDRAPVLRAAIDEHMPTVFHNTEQYANNRIECDHGRLKVRLRPMRGLKRDHTARVVMRGHALMQNIRRGRYELGVDARAHRCIEIAFTEVARTI